MMSRIRTIKPEFWKGHQESWGGARSKLYIIQEETTELIKIGIAGHPSRRLVTLQCGNSRRLHLRAVYEGPPDVCMAVEKFILKHFHSWRIGGGEWMRRSVEQVTHLLADFEETAE